MPARTDKSDATKTRILEVAHEVFAAKGYVGAALSDIVARAGVTTGALYHHFGGKEGLFVAVAERAEQAVLDAAASSLSAAASPREALESGLSGVLEICARPDFQRILFRDAPTVVGPAKWREIEMRYAFGMMRQTIRDLAEAGLLDAPDPDITAQILLGATIEAAHGIALAGDRAAALVAARRTLGMMLRSLSKD